MSNEDIQWIEQLAHQEVQWVEQLEEHAAEPHSSIEPHHSSDPVESFQLPGPGPDLHGNPQEIAGYVPPPVTDGREAMTPERVVGDQQLEQQGPAPSAHTVGDPNTDAHYWTYMGTDSGFCGPDSLSMVLNEFGIHDSESAVAAWALNHGDVTGTGPNGQIEPAPGELGFGMTSGQMAEVLNAAGVPAVTMVGNQESLVEALHSGRDVILSVDANQLWHNAPAGTREGHAVVLTGIDPSTNTAYINDPGYPDGRMEAVPLSELMGAWGGAGNQMVETLQTPEVHTAQYGTAQAAATRPGPVILPLTIHARQ